MKIQINGSLNISRSPHTSASVALYNVPRSRRYQGYNHWCSPPTSHHLSLPPCRLQLHRLVQRSSSWLLYLFNTQGHHLDNTAVVRRKESHVSRLSACKQQPWASTPFPILQISADQHTSRTIPWTTSAIRV